MKTKYKIFLAKKIYKIISLFISKNFICERKGLKWDIDLSEAIDLHIFLFGYFEQDIKITAKKMNLNKHKVILDIGANFGVQSLQFASNFNNSKIFAIEPTKYAFEKMIKNFDLNQDFAKNIYPEQIFLSSYNKKLPSGVYSSWNLDINSEQHAKHKGTKKETIDSKIYTLDEFTDLKNIKDVDFIKLDVDGFELDVIKGGSKYLKMFKPPIFMELAPYLYNEYGYSIDELINNLRSLNYEFYDMKKLTKIKDIYSYSKNVNDGSSTNILLR